MDGSTAPDEITAVDSDDFSIRKALSKYLQCHYVRRLIVDRYKNALIGDSEIRVACRHSAPVDDEFLWHGEFFYCK